MTKIKPGEIYIQTAIRVARQDRRIIPIDEVLKGSLEDLEKKLNIIPYIEAECKELSRKLLEYKVSPPYSTAQILVYSASPFYRLRGFSINLEKCHLTESEKTEIIVSMLRAVHNVWVKNHPEDFFDPELESKRYRYAAFELVGYYGISEYCLAYVSGLVQVLGWNMNSVLLPVIYHRRREAFIEKYGLEEPGSLFTFVRKGMECPLPKKVFQYFQTEEGAETVRQITENMV